LVILRCTLSTELQRACFTDGHETPMVWERLREEVKNDTPTKKMESPTALSQRACRRIKP
jgi:hypothetical protein